jgi:hypothetical protein
MIQSAEVCDSCEHLTLEEKGQLASHGAKSGRKIGILFSLHLVIVACSFLYSIRVFFVLLGQERCNRTAWAGHLMLRSEGRGRTIAVVIHSYRRSYHRLIPAGARPPPSLSRELGHQSTSKSLSSPEASLGWVRPVDPLNRKHTFVAMTMSLRAMSRFFSDCPRILSLSPSVYTSAVSKKLIPASIDVLMRASASDWPCAPTNLKIPRPSPKVMVPKQSLETIELLERRFPDGLVAVTELEEQRLHLPRRDGERLQLFLEKGHGVCRPGGQIKQRPRGRRFPFLEGNPPGLPLLFIGGRRPRRARRAIDRCQRGDSEHDSDQAAHKPGDRKDDRARRISRERLWQLIHSDTPVRGGRRNQRCRTDVILPY